MNHIAVPGARAYPHKITEPPKNFAAELPTLLSHLRMSQCYQGQKDVIQLYLASAIQTAEEYTGLDLITRTQQTFRDFFPQALNEGFYSEGYIPDSCFGSYGNTGIEIRRSPLQEVTEVAYLAADGVTWNVVDPAVYYVTAPEAGKYGAVLLNPGQRWPTDKANREDSVRITFTSGFGDDSNSIPADIRLGILQHASALYSNRGDCGSGCGGLPGDCKMAYDRWRIRRI